MYGIGKDFRRAGKAARDFQNASAVFSGPLRDQYGLSAEKTDEFARRVSKGRCRGAGLSFLDMK
jgi:hypothetical protein